MVKQRKYVVKKPFQGTPKREDFQIVETELPPIQNGDILLKTEWVSVESYQYTFSGFQTPHDTFGYQIGVVIESKNPKYPEGSRVVSHYGWTDYSIINEAKNSPGFSVPFYLLPDLKGLPASLGLGAIGMPGATAYFGFLEVCQPKAGETVVVSGASGAVGSVVGQIAKIKGCRVIGFAGSSEKCQWLEKELGYDKAINYKTEDIVTALKKAAPGGVDCYFDAVGGKISSQVMSQMNDSGRVAVCGSSGSVDDSPKATNIFQSSLASKQLKIQSFNVWSWSPEQWAEAFEELIKWLKAGQLKVREQITEGFDNIYNAFVEMLSGKNIGKAVVKI